MLGQIWSNVFIGGCICVGVVDLLIIIWLISRWCHAFVNDTKTTIPEILKTLDKIIYGDYCESSFGVLIISICLNSFAICIIWLVWPIITAGLMLYGILLMVRKVFRVSKSIKVLYEYAHKHLSKEGVEPIKEPKYEGVK